MAPVADSRRHLARAGWSILRPQSAPETGPPESYEALGAQLVSEVASSWTRKYQFTIKKHGFDGDCAFHYECIFSAPSNLVPVPSFILSTRFALVLPSLEADPRLLYAFEEGDLRHEWALVRAGVGQWRAAAGQQYCSLGDGRFELYIDRLFHDKEQAVEEARDRGVDLRTSFEMTRLEKPPAYSEEGSSEEESEEDQEHAFLTRSSCSSPSHKLHPALAEEGAALEAAQGMALVMREAMKAAGLYCDKVEPPASLAELLASIFDAADEESIGELPHYEVARLLGATLPGFGLELWDIHLLMTSAQENDNGFIECKPFIQAAPEIIQALRKRRMAYRDRGLPGVEVPQEAVKHCFTDDATETAKQLMKVFEQCTQEEKGCGKWQKHADQEQQGHHHQPHHRMRSKAAHGQEQRGSLQAQGTGSSEDQSLVGIKRRFCQDCILSLPERLSPQEAMRLMQMLPEDEEGFIMIEELIEYLEHLRTDAMLNALVESDVLSLRTHLVLRFRHLGLTEDGKLKLWVIKDALLQADQVCLTVLQIHTLLCLANADSSGLVDIAEFLGMCCVVIPHMFDARLFVETAERLILEHAESLRRAENEEMAALGAAQVVRQTGGEGEETQENKEVDEDTVERILQQILSLNDDLHRTPPALTSDTIYSILCVNEKEVQTTQLRSFEVAGFLAEMRPDAEGFVAYVDHIKKWVPIIFEQRKDCLLMRYLEVGSAEALGIETPDLQKLEDIFPLLPNNNAFPLKRGSQRRSSRVSREHGSIMSNAPSHRSPSKLDPDGVTRRGSRLQTLGSRRPSLAPPDLSEQMKNSRSGSKRNLLQKEPPPGRGFLRRKNKLLAVAAGAHQMAATFQG